MKSVVLVTLALAAVSNALARPRYPMVKLQNTFFGLMALRSASPIHFGEINANNRNLWIGKSPSTFCPGVQGLNCANITTPRTTYSVSNGILSLAVQVASGQMVYIESCGRVSYTPASDPQRIPVGATVTGWSLDYGPKFNMLSHVNGTYFCPTTPVDPNAPPVAGQSGHFPGPWEFYVGVTIDLPQGCLYATLVAEGNSINTTAYQYN